MLEDTHAHIVTPLDLTAMQASAREIEGTHDFKCFEATGSIVKNTVRTVYSISITAKTLDGNKTLDDTQRVSEGIIEVAVTGNGFLYNMVRIIAGTLTYAGMGKLTPAEIKHIIATADRTLAGKTMPAKGLCLKSVEYD
jgi:tRNA pseudouridine38-40 synthase